MAKKTERESSRRGLKTAKKQDEQNRVVEVVLKAGEEVTPLLMDAKQGSKTLCVSLTTFYKVMRKSESAPMIQIGSLQRWRKKDLFRFMGKAFRCTVEEDFLIDAKAAATLCAVSSQMLYKMSRAEGMPNAVTGGRTLRWSCQEIVEWIGAGCPARVKRRSGKKQSEG